jgi:hypothetical protein
LVQIFCVLVDTIEEGHGPPVSKEETQTITDGLQVLGKLENDLIEALPLRKRK